MDAPWILPAYLGYGDLTEKDASKERLYFGLNARRGGWFNIHSEYAFQYDHTYSRGYYPVYEVLTDYEGAYDVLVGNRPQSYLVFYDGERSVEAQEQRTTASWRSKVTSCPVFSVDEYRRLTPYTQTPAGDIDVLQVGTEYARVRLDSGTSGWVSRRCLNVPIENVLYETTRVEIAPRMPSTEEAVMVRSTMHRCLSRYLKSCGQACDENALKNKLDSLLEHVLGAPFEPFSDPRLDTGPPAPFSRDELLPGVPTAEVAPSDMYFLLTLLNHSTIAEGSIAFPGIEFVGAYALATAEEATFSYGLLPTQNEQAAMLDAMAVLFGEAWPQIARMTTGSESLIGREDGHDYSLSPLVPLPDRGLSMDAKVARVMANVSMLLDVEMLWHPSSSDFTFRPGTSHSVKMKETNEGHVAHTHPYHRVPVMVTEQGRVYASQRGHTVRLYAPPDVSGEIWAHGYHGDLISDTPVLSTIVMANGDTASMQLSGTLDYSPELLLRTPVGRVRTSVKWMRRE